MFNFIKIKHLAVLLRAILQMKYEAMNFNSTCVFYVRSRILEKTNPYQFAETDKMAKNSSYSFMILCAETTYCFEV